MKNILWVLFVGLFLAVPAGYAAEQTVTGAQRMTEAQFLSAPEQHGLSPRVAVKKYELYRRTLGNVPRPNLDRTRLRSDEIRGRF